MKFEAAIKFQEDALAIRAMTPEDVMLVADFYDKYEFTGGLDLCDAVLLDYFTRNKNKNPEKEAPENLDLLVDAIALADKLMLKKSRIVGNGFLEARLNSVSVPYGRIMFTEDHFKTILPMLKNKTVNFGFIRGNPPEEMDSLLFPKYIVMALSDYRASKILAFMISKIIVSGTNSEIDGEFTIDITGECYESGRRCRWNGEEVTLDIDRNDDWDWAIIGELKILRANDDGDSDEEEYDLFQVVLWKCPYSRNLKWPPNEPSWVPVEKLAHGTPKIECVLTSMLAYGHDQTQYTLNQSITTCKACLAPVFYSHCASGIG